MSWILIPMNSVHNVGLSCLFLSALPSGTPWKAAAEVLGTFDNCTWLRHNKEDFSSKVKSEQIMGTSWDDTPRSTTCGLKFHTLLTIPPFYNRFLEPHICLVLKEGNAWVQRATRHSLSLLWGDYRLKETTQVGFMKTTQKQAYFSGMCGLVVSLFSFSLALSILL